LTSFPPKFIATRLGRAETLQTGIGLGEEFAPEPFQFEQGVARAIAAGGLPADQTCTMNVKPCAGKIGGE